MSDELNKLRAWASRAIRYQNDDAAALGATLYHLACLRQLEVMIESGDPEYPADLATPAIRRLSDILRLSGALAERVLAKEAEQP